MTNTVTHKLLLNGHAIRVFQKLVLLPQFVDQIQIELKLHANSKTQSYQIQKTILNLYPMIATRSTDDLVRIMNTDF